MRYVKALKIGKVERYELDLAAWLDSEPLVSATVTPTAEASQVGVVDIVGGVIGFFLTGVGSGVCTLEFNYTTATRTDCYKLYVRVTDC